MNKFDIAERTSEMLISSRKLKGYSREYMAKSLGVSAKTIQNWEEGMSSPTYANILCWFEALNLNPVPYLLEVSFPHSFDTSASDQVSSIMVALNEDLQEKFLYILKGEHGSYPGYLLEMMTAYLHIPMKDRINIAHTIINNYTVAEMEDSLICTDDVKPNMDALAGAYRKAKTAVLDSREGYM